MDIWRLITEKMATLEELKTSWTMDDVDRAIAVLNLKADIENEMTKSL